MSFVKLKGNLKMNRSKIHNCAVCMVLCALLVFAVGPGAIAEEVVPPEKAHLRSVLVRKNYVFASNIHGLFRASKSDKKWVALPIPSSMPPKGYFAKQPCGVTPIFYYAGNWMAWNMPDAEKKVFGLYVSQDNGQHWQLVSKDYDFRKMFLHPDGTLYAIVAMEKKIGPEKAKKTAGVWLSDQADEEGNKTISFNRILMSIDSGRSWRDISSGIGRGFTLASIFQDPDHPELVCLNGGDIRAYVLQATDKNYKWQTTRHWDWWKTRETEEEFFRGAYSSGDGRYLHFATLSNYFDYPFDSRTTIRGLRITTDWESYTFTDSNEVAVRVEVSYIREESQVKFLDLDNQLDFWGMKRILPNGERETIVPSIDRSFSKWKLEKSKMLGACRGTC